MRLLDENFYFLMALLVAAVVVYGFSRTVERKLIHPAVPRPLILYVHAAVFSVWVVFFIGQAVLVRMNKVGWHRNTGWFGAVLGATVAAIGIWTAVAMERFNLVQLHQNDAPLTLLRSFYDITAFAAAFALAIYWRTKPEFHRRLMLVAMCALTDPAFSRFPGLPIALGAYQDYACVDLLILLGVARDLTVSKRVSRVYLLALLGFVVCQIVTIQTIRRNSQYWLKIVHAILG